MFNHIVEEPIEPSTDVPDNCPNVISSEVVDNNMDDLFELIPFCIKQRVRINDSNHSENTNIFLNSGLYGYDIEYMKLKPWNESTADITDYFNYGFNEVTWRNFCNNDEAIHKFINGELPNFITKRSRDSNLPPPPPFPTELIPNSTVIPTNNQSNAMNSQLTNKPCFSWRNGYCSKANCGYMHLEHEFNINNLYQSLNSTNKPVTVDNTMNKSLAFPISEPNVPKFEKNVMEVPSSKVNSNTRSSPPPMKAVSKARVPRSPPRSPPDL